MHEVRLPELGEGISKATVACFHYRRGEQVKKDDDIAELVTDKASFSVSAGCDGIIDEIFFKEGQDAKIGDVLVRIKF